MSESLTRELFLKLRRYQGLDSDQGLVDPCEWANGFEILNAPISELDEHIYYLARVPS